MLLLHRNCKARQYLLQSYFACKVYYVFLIVPNDLEIINILLLFCVQFQIEYFVC